MCDDRPSGPRRGTLLAGAAALAGLLAAWHAWRAPGPGPVDTTGWHVADVAVHLQGRGVAFEAVADHPQFQEGTYLTRTGKSLAELRRLPRNERALGAWRGTVRCERALPWEDVGDRMAEWGPAGFSDGNFLFFGDPEMVREIRDALAVG